MRRDVGLPDITSCVQQFDDGLCLNAVTDDDGGGCDAADILCGCCRGASWLGPFVTMIYQMCRTDCVRFLVIYVVFISGFVQGRLPACC